jgi:hypothetical protein
LRDNRYQPTSEVSFKRFRRRLRLTCVCVVRRPWCTDQRDGRTDPEARLASRDADGLRAAELQHPV